MKAQLFPLLIGSLLLVSQQVGRSEELHFGKAFGSRGHIDSSFDGVDSQLVRAEAPVAPASFSEFALTDFVSDESVGGKCAGGECASGECAGTECGVGCLDPCSVPKWRAFGEFLFLRPSGERVAFAVPINGAIVPPAGAAPVPIGLEAAVDCDFEAGFRVGGSYYLDECSDLVATYTHFESDTTNQIGINPPYVIRSLVNHPGTQAAPTDFLAASARLDLDFELADLEYRRLFSCSPKHAVYYSAGFRYSHLDQLFSSSLTNATTTETVSSQVRFDGGGIRVGLEGERYLAKCGLMAYGRSAVSFVGGNFRGRYLQNNTQQGDVVISGLNEDGVISMLDLEIGLGWASSDGSWRATAGYMFSGWFNTLNTDEFIQAVQTNNSVSIGDSLGFDGLVVRTEYRY